MHTMLWHAQAHISANWGRIGKIKVSTESGEHADRDYDVRAHACKHARMLACMHTMLWRAQAHISANLGRIGKIKISTESGEHPDRDYDVRAHARKHARMLACMHTIF